MTEADLEEFLALHNEYAAPSWVHRVEQVNKLIQAVGQISKIGKKEEGIKRGIKATQERTYDEIMAAARQQRQDSKAAEKRKQDSAQANKGGGADTETATV